MEIFKIVALALSGSLLIFGGLTRIIDPVKNYMKGTGIKIENEVNNLSEARGVSALMTLGGIIMLLGIFIPMMAMTSHVVAILILMGFGFGRLLSFVLDGKPNKLLVTGLVSELVLGTLNIISLIHILT